MLTHAEIKIVIATLNSRRTWLRKTLGGETDLEKAQRDEHQEALRLIESSLKKLARMTENPAMPAAGSSRKQPVIRALVAEDSEESANLLVELLGDLGIRDVDVARDGMDAFDKIKSAAEPYSLILCDWNMPALSGLEVYRKARASNTLRGAHFMMVTAVTEAARIREAIQLGINDYLVKPLDAETLETKIRAALGELMPEREKKTG